MLSDFLHVGVLTSDRARGLDGLLHHPFRGTLYDVDCILTRHPPRDLALRASFDEETAELLWQSGVDTVLLLGYLWIATEPLLSAFPNRIFNVHDGLQRYPGLHATREAILAGESETYSIVHHVTPALDGGPVIARSRPLPVAPFVREAVMIGATDIVRAYAYAHREWMIRSTWSDLLVHALEEVAAGADVGVGA